MTTAYPAQFMPEETGGFSVRIPDLNGTKEGAWTCGDDLEDARRMASDLVDTWMSLHFEAAADPPRPGALPSVSGWEMVRPSARAEWVLSLRSRRRKLGWSQEQAARAMGVLQPAYARLEDPTRANPTLSTMVKAERALGVKVSFGMDEELHDAVLAGP